MQSKNEAGAVKAGALAIWVCLCAAPSAALATAQPTQPGTTPETAADLAAQATGGASGVSPQITPWTQLTVHAGSTLSGLFARAGLAAPQWHALLALGGPTGALKRLQPGETIDIRKTPGGALAELRFQLSRLRTLHVTRVGGQLQARVVHAPTETRRITARGTVHRSLTNALKSDGVPAAIAAQLGHIYHYRHNLRRLQSGDKFAVVYRATYSKGREVKAGPVLAASITTNHHNYRAFRAQRKDGSYGYFDSTGQSYKPAFTRKPVNYTRISSPFSLHRMNPITHKVEPHYGVDMAAPIGTPIHAAAEGTVKYAGWARGYGRLVELRNFDGYSTRYAHMHKFRSGLRDGEHVHKGEIIGYVGESGEATGPHLHFEIRIHGKPHNPMTVKLPAGQALSKTRLAAFKQRIRPLVAKLSPMPSTILARNAADHRSAAAGDCAQPTSMTARLSLAPLAAHHGHRHILCLVKRHQTNA